MSSENDAPLREEWMHRNANGGGTICRSRAEAEKAQADLLWRREHKHPTEPMPPESAGIFRRYVTEWTLAEGES